MDDSNKEQMRYNTDDEARERDGNASDVPHMLDEEANTRPLSATPLARQMEDLIADTQDWMEMSQSEEARDIYNTLVPIFTSGSTTRLKTPTTKRGWAKKHCSRLTFLSDQRLLRLERENS